MGLYRSSCLVWVFWFAVRIYICGVPLFQPTWPALLLWPLYYPNEYEAVCMSVSLFLYTMIILICVYIYNIQISLYLVACNMHMSLKMSGMPVRYCVCVPLLDNLFIFMYIYIYVCIHAHIYRSRECIHMWEIIYHRNCICIFCI